MSLYLITYDLHTPGQKYQKIFDTIQKISSGHCKPLLSVWLVAYTGTAKQLYNKLAPCIDKNDKILITEFSCHNYFGFLNQNIWDWLKSACS